MRRNCYMYLYIHFESAVLLIYLHLLFSQFLNDKFLSKNAQEIPV